MVSIGGLGARCTKGLPAQDGSHGKQRNTHVRAVVVRGVGHTPAEKNRSLQHSSYRACTRQSERERERLK